MRLPLTIFMLFLVSAQAFGMPIYDEVKAAYQPSDAVLLDRHGEVIHALRVQSLAG